MDQDAFKHLGEDYTEAGMDDQFTINLNDGQELTVPRSHLSYNESGTVSVDGRVIHAEDINTFERNEPVKLEARVDTSTPTDTGADEKPTPRLITKSIKRQQ